MLPRSTSFRFCVKVREDGRPENRRTLGQVVSKRNSRSGHGNTQKKENKGYKNGGLQKLK